MRHQLCTPDVQTVNVQEGAGGLCPLFWNRRKKEAEQIATAIHRGITKGGANDKDGEKVNANFI